MQESDQQTPAIKARNYKYHQEDFEFIVQDIGKIFSLQDEDDKKKIKKSASTSSLEEGEEKDYLDKYIGILPELNKEAIDILTEIFGVKGLSLINFNYLALFRHFHYSKYK
jgi:hypothetical protein